MINHKKGSRSIFMLLTAVAILLVVSIAANSLQGPTKASAPVQAGSSGPGLNAPQGISANKPAAVVNNAKTEYKTYPNGVTTGTDAAHGVSIPARDLPLATSLGKPKRIIEHENPVPFRPPVTTLKDPVVQRSFGAFAMPTPSLTFDGMSFVSSNSSGEPPDTNGDIGLTQYVQTVNQAFQVWDKNGVSIMAPRQINTLFSSLTGRPCATFNQGDPVVVYDPLANRWVITQFAFANFPGPPPFAQCIAVSQTSDATGAYNVYEFDISNTLFGDYPKYGVWPDAYYATLNQFNQTGNFDSPLVIAFDRASMLTGQPATFQTASPGNFYANLLPADMDGTTPPPVGAPNTVVTVSGNNTLVHTFKYHVDFTNPANSTFTGPFDLAAAPWDPNLCGGAPCIQQPGTTSLLDTLGDHTMFRLAYRNYGDHESMMISESVDENGQDHSGIRWYELRGVSNTPYIYQQGTYAPDALQRWMPSIAQDRDGNIAVGYSVSSSTLFPSLRYAGRLASDPLGQLAQGEANLFTGTGSQTNTRWGDYSDMTVDPVDDCTFWFTSEYYPTISDFNWKTRIGRFKFASCGNTTPTPTVTGTHATATTTAVASSTVAPQPTECANYVSTTGTGTIAPGTLDIGNHCDDCSTFITLPFQIQLYGQSFTNAYVSSNGVLEFGSSDFAFGNAPLPVPVFNHAVLGYWDDLITNAAGDGVFTSVTGNAPNRVFNVEWRAQVLGQQNTNLNFEIQMLEGQSTVNIIYGSEIGTTGSGATIGIQRDLGSFTQIAYNMPGSVTANRQYTLTLPPCNTTTPTSTSGTTSTPTRTTTRTTTTASVTTTRTAVVTGTRTAQTTTTATTTACAIQFQDVQPNSTFYSFVRCLACRGVMGGYPCGSAGEPCGSTNNPYFRPNNSITRGQLSKIVANTAGFSEAVPVGTQTYTDVVPSSPFYDFIERLSVRNVIGGYPCGGTGEPCDSQRRPYFRPGNNVSRGQTAKIVALAANERGTVPSDKQTYQDVTSNNAFYLYIEQLTARGVMGGYACGGPGEPCVAPGNKPYFRPGFDVTRGQASKIVANTFYPNCQTPSR